MSAVDTQLQLYSKPLVKRAHALLRDLTLATRYAGELRNLLRGNPGDDPARSETSAKSYESRSEMLDALIEIVVPRVYPARRQPYSRGAIASEGLTRPWEDELWLFVNGIATAPAVIKANGKELARIFQRPIHLVHNPTDGALLDLAECVLGRTFSFTTGLSRYVLDIVSRALSGYSKVVLIGHSQGGIVVADVANALVRSFSKPDLLKNLEIYTFASAADKMLAHEALSVTANHCVPYYEHFANRHDFVALFGVISCKKAIAGPLFVAKNRTGHLLNSHYLVAFEKGVYCGRNSRLFQYVGGNAAGDFFEALPATFRSTDYAYAAV